MSIRSLNPQRGRSLFRGDEIETVGDPSAELWAELAELRRRLSTLEDEVVRLKVTP